MSLSPLSWEMKFGALLLGLGLIVGMVSYFISTGEKLNEAKHIKANAAAQTHVLETAIAVAGDFAKLGQEIVQKVTNVRVETQTVIEKQVKYVHDKPLPSTCALADPIVQLRNDQLRHLYEAAGRQLPVDSDGRRTAPNADDKAAVVKPVDAGLDHRQR